MKSSSQGLRRLLRRPSPGMVVAVIALVFSLGGASAVAASKLITGADIKQGSVTGGDIRNGSLGGADVSNKSIQAEDLASSALPATGPQGPAGPTGPTGPQGIKGDT